ncbi:aflatoxin aldehyde reductase [Coccidioides immitis H538.4]|uniref:Aflatoxin aldehyde reductase n=1 Tax=Coccidioides immitis H538.4 TaxID=396776 RepID=A0A0J8S023_COCIT|nr:aflatoxin aldehyde reductase [Coccidioides immitis H538.4]
MPLVVPHSGPRVILGLMTFGPDEKEGARITSLDEFKKCLDCLTANNFYEIDTARIYVGGQQEAFTAQAGWRDRGLKIATKWYPRNAGDHKPEVIRQNLEKSLKELQTDCVDIFYLHAADRSVPSRYFKDATFDALRIIEPVAQKHNLTLIEIALRWVCYHSALNIKDGGNDGIIVGVSSLKQLEGNLADIKRGPLPEEVVATLE